MGADGAENLAHQKLMDPGGRGGSGFWVYLGVGLSGAVGEGGLLQVLRKFRLRVSVFETSTPPSLCSQHYMRAQTLTRLNPAVR